MPWRYAMRSLCSKNKLHMKTIKTFLATIALVLLTLGLQAQSRMTDVQKEEAKAKYQAYRAKLELTDEQSTKVEAINTSFFESLATLRASGESKLSKYKQFKKLQSDKDKQMKDVLNDRQFKLYKAFQAEMKEDFKENRRENNKG
jgi:hypothetical protein